MNRIWLIRRASLQERLSVCLRRLFSRTDAERLLNCRFLVRIALESDYHEWRDGARTPLLIFVAHAAKKKWYNMRSLDKAQLGEL